MDEIVLDDSGPDSTEEVLELSNSEDEDEPEAFEYKKIPTDKDWFAQVRPDYRDTARCFIIISFKKRQKILDQISSLPVLYDISAILQNMLFYVRQNEIAVPYHLN